ncbi:MAG: T9SS type A sorting domain-containing protein [Candidatus Kapaibacterium sp.]
MKNLKAKIPFFILIIFLCVTSGLYAQKAPDIQWQKCLGGTGNDNATSVIQTLDGGYAVAGSTSSSDGEVSGFHGVMDGWIVKLNSIGAIQWQKCLGGSKDDRLNQIIQTLDKGYAVVGTTSSNDGDVLGNHGYGDGWVVKLDSSGNIEWQTCVGGKGDEGLNSILQTSDSEFVVAGQESSSEEGLLNHGRSDAYVVKLSSSGKMLWQKCMGGSSIDAASFITQTSEGGYAFTGSTSSNNDGDVSGYHFDSTLANFPIRDIWVVKIDPFGNLEWQKCLGGKGDDAGYSITADSHGGVTIAGMTFSNDGDVSGNHNTDGNNDAWIVNLDSSGKMLWQECLGGSRTDVANFITKTIEGGYAIAGTTSSNDGDVSGKHGGKDTSDIWIAELTSSGNIQWQKCLGGSSFERGGVIIQTSDKGYMVAGTTSSNDGDVSGYIGGNDIWVVKLKPVSSGVENTSPVQDNVARIYPNPSTDEIHLALSRSSSVKQILFYDLLGMQFFPEYRIEDRAATVDVHNLPAGSYIVRLNYVGEGQPNFEEVQKFVHYH